MPQLRIGTCGWKYPSWAGLVYSTEKTNFLSEYCSRFTTVEVDQWFWSLFGSGASRLPHWADAEHYRRCVPDDFRFTVKVPNSITLTHFRAKAKTDPLVPNPHFLSASLFNRFLDCLEPLHPVLGPLIFQFESLNWKKMNGPEEFQRLFGEFVGQLPTGFGYALEIRNPDYLDDDFFLFMGERRLVPVLLEGYWMPSVVQVYNKCRSALLKHPAVVVRLHGPDRDGTERQTGDSWGALIVRRDDEMAGIVGMVRELLEAGVDVYLNVNNHYEGCAPLTIERIERLLGPS